MGQAAQAPSGTRDLLADEVRRRKTTFHTFTQIFENFGFDPLEIPTFENLEVITREVRVRSIFGGFWLLGNSAIFEPFRNRGGRPRTCLVRGRT